MSSAKPREEELDLEGITRRAGERKKGNMVGGPGQQQNSHLNQGTHQKMMT